MFQSTRALLFVAAILAVTQAQFPSYIRKCSRTDPNLSSCIMRHGNLALEDIVNGIEVSNKGDGYELGPIQFNIDDDLEFNLIDARSKTYGLRLTTDTVLNFEAKEAVLHFESPEISITADFNISGTWKGEKIVQRGSTKLTLDRSSFRWTPEITRKEDNGKQYFFMKSAKCMMTFETFSYIASVDYVQGGEENLYKLNWNTIERNVLERFNNIARDLTTRTVNKYLALSTADEVFLP